MAIQFARAEYVSRSSGKNACCKGAYNSRTKIKDEKTNIVYNFTSRKDNVYHEVLLPEYVHQKFKNISELMNMIERTERKCNSQLLKEYVLALPDEENISLELKKEMVYEFIRENKWIENGLGVQVDIHKPHDGEKNWHAHLLVTIRRFLDTGLCFESKKARDLEPQVRGGRTNTYVKSNEEFNLGKLWSQIQNRIFEQYGLENRVDSIGINPQEHIGPVRMRSVMNGAVVRNEERRIVEIEHLNNGMAVLDKVTRHMSVFSSSNLKQAVKCIPDKETRERLVEEALAGKSIINLFTSDGRKTNLYTTTGIRAEEEKIMRLAGYVLLEKNVISLGGSKAVNRVNQLIADEKTSNSRFSDEQEKALSQLLLGDSGVRVLRGRAGSGKSYILGKVCRISESAGVNVIGVAPTHKAKLELAKVGYEQNDTVKGMLFKLANGRFSLPKHSLIVVDEAGMVGNDDYQELLRVAATRKCNLILAGDERQLSSVSRGGMFEVLSEKQGSSTVFDIKRQSSNWGREVASCFAGGRVLEGLNILERNERIKWSGNADKSMQELLSNWNDSKYDIGDRIILAVENKHVNALNAGARQYLKANGKLEGEEISVSGNYYMKGDRILITATNKELRVINGDLGEVIGASTEKFIISILGSEKTIEFNPKEYDGFRHGYATTIFKAQGASIKDVYVFHDKFSGIRNSYLSLSRHIDELRLYTNRESTIDMKMLVKQLSRDFDKGSSLQYLTEEEIRYRNNVGEAKKTITGRLLVGALNVLEKVTDKYIPKSEYYNYKEPARAITTVEKVNDRLVLEEEALGFSVEHKIAVGENTGTRISDVLREVSTTNKPRMSAKERFYANADYVRGQKNRADLKAEWDRETEELRHMLKFKVESIACDLLGEPNKRLSNGRELRYGEHGKIAVRIKGEKAGMWHDFSNDKGGDLFSLVTHVKGGSFKTAAEYLRGVIGMENTGNLQLVHDHNSSDKYASYQKAKKFEEKLEKQKLKVTSNLQVRAKEINHNNVAYRYLREERNITCDLGSDIKTAGVYERGVGKSFPALIAFARDESGNITGGLQILLDSKTGNKAEVDIPKKSFGRISGSFVDVGSIRNNSDHKDNITIIAEGLETALSVKQALSEHSEKKGDTEAVRILCSLGISNIKNYKAREGEKIIIAADNDSHDSTTHKTIENASFKLSSKGAFVEIVRPIKVGDFNDILKDKALGEKEIQNSFKNVLASYSAVTLTEYLSRNKAAYQLSHQEKENLAYIQKYDLSEKDIVEAYRRDRTYGMLELEQSRKSLELAAACYKQNKEMLLEAKNWGYKASEAEIVKSLIGIDADDAKKHCMEIRDNQLFGYLEKNIREFTKQKTGKYDIELIKPIVLAEQEFLKETYETCKAFRGKENEDFEVPHSLRSGQVISEQPDLLKKVFEVADSLYQSGGQSEINIARNMSSVNEMDVLHTILDREMESYNVYDRPRELAKEGLHSDSVDNALTAIEKEQDYLASLDSNLNHYSWDEKLIEKVKLASDQKGSKCFEALKTATYQSLESQVKTEYELLDKLKQTTDLKASYTELDKHIEVHNINTTLRGFMEEKQTAKTPDEVINIISKEQEFLVSLRDNIKYPDEHQDLLAKSEIAKKLQEEKMIDKLGGATKEIISSGIKNEKTLMKELKNTSDIQVTYQKLDKDIEAHNINVNLMKIKEEKYNAKTPRAALQAAHREQQFLSSLHGNLRHQDHNIGLLHNINKAHQSELNKDMDRLREVAGYGYKSKIFSEQELTKHFKSDCSISELHRDLSKICHNHHTNIINRHLDKLHDNLSVRHDGHKFECPIKYLEHWKNNVDHNLLPIKQINQIIKQEHNRQHEMEHSYTMDM
jgi:Ti-type conjugative transfer relaxase TraA